MSSRDGWSWELEDLMPQMRRESDIGWALASKSFPDPPSDRRAELESVLSSRRVQTAIAAEAAASGRPEAEVEAEGRAVLEEMAAAFSVRSVRGVGLVVHKAFQSLFSELLVNTGCVAELRRALAAGPVVLLPSHRSYLDFLLLTYVAFSLDLRPPLIAAGMDFLGMRLIGEALRQCGAFFIRRSFGSDALYWALFAEYVGRTVATSGQPLEFFVEGTRSRSGKSLPPKTGLLGVALEPFLRREVFDVTLVPVSVSYSRLLEERLYAYELLGFPKPPESTSGLLKARSVLGTSLGSVTLRFAEPISARDFFRPRIELGLPHNLSGPSGWEATEEEKAALRELAGHVVAVHQGLRDASVWQLLCLTLALRPRPSTDLQHLLQRLHSLRELLRAVTGLEVPRRQGRSVSEEVAFLLRQHSNLICLDETGQWLLLLPLEKGAALATPADGSGLSGSAVERSLTPVALAAYANGILWRLRDPAFVLIALKGALRRRRSEAAEVGRLREDFAFLRGRLFAREFVAEREQEEAHFQSAVSGLARAGVVSLGPGGSVRLLAESEASLLSEPFQPFLFAYAALLLHAIHGGRFPSEAALVSGAQGRLAALVEGDAVGWHHVLSTDTLKAAVATFKAIGPLKASPGVGVSVDATSAAVVAERLGGLLEPSLCGALRLPHLRRPPPPKARL